jgi:hypothetical protein
MLPAASRTESPGYTASQTRRTANDCYPPVGGVSGQEPFAARAAPPAHRQALIDRVRLQIANGCYESQAKIEALLPRLARDLGLARTL